MGILGPNLQITESWIDRKRILASGAPVRGFSTQTPKAEPRHLLGTVFLRLRPRTLCAPVPAVDERTESSVAPT